MNHIWWKCESVSGSLELYHISTKEVSTFS